MNPFAGLDPKRWPVTTWLVDNWPESRYTRMIDADFDVGSGTQRFCLWGVAMYLMPAALRERFKSLLAYGDALHGQRAHLGTHKSYLVWLNDTAGHAAAIEAVAILETVMRGAPE